MIGNIFFAEGDYNYGRLEKLRRDGEEKFHTTQLLMVARYI